MAANPLSNEAQLYARIKQEHISVHPLVWDKMYRYLGEYITVIELIATYSRKVKEPISIDDARKILSYTRKINELVKEILHPAGNPPLQMTLHPLISEFFTHYISNDAHCINMIVSFHLDPADEQPVPVEYVQKIINHTSSMRAFLDKLRVATLG